MRISSRFSSELALLHVDGISNDASQRQLGPKRYRFEWTPNASDVTAGKRTIQFEAHDGRGGIATQTLEVTVLATAPNRNPSILSKPRTVAYPGIPYAYLVVAQDRMATRCSIH